jgi:hypothetical protein
MPPVDPAEHPKPVISTDSEGSRFLRETEEEWRDPDKVSFAMLLRGILPMLLECYPLCVYA